MLLTSSFRRSGRVDFQVPNMTSLWIIWAVATGAQSCPQGAAGGGAAGAFAAGHFFCGQAGKTTSAVHRLVTEADGVLVEVHEAWCSRSLIWRVTYNFSKRRHYFIITACKFMENKPSQIMFFLKNYFELINHASSTKTNRLDNLGVKSLNFFANSCFWWFLLIFGTIAPSI